MIYSLRAPVSVDLLIEGVSKFAEVQIMPLPDTVAELALGPCPLLYLDIDSEPEDQAWALLDALRALTFGAESAESARWARRLRSVG
jgi:hypothetical protein